jgi:hypothetical protein
MPEYLSKRTTRRAIFPQSRCPSCGCDEGRELACLHWRRLSLAVIEQLTAGMSCRIAVNMAKRAAAGAVSVSVWLDEETSASVRAVDLPMALATSSQHSSHKGNPPKYRRAHVIITAFCVFAVLGFISYGAYAHEWAELSALRHLGKPLPAASQAVGSQRAHMRG